MTRVVIRLRATRPTLVRGHRVEAGCRLELPPLEAANLITTGRAELVNPEDFAACQTAQRRHTSALLRAQPGPHRDGTDDGPWRPVG